MSKTNVMVRSLEWHMRRLERHANSMIRAKLNKGEIDECHLDVCKSLADGYGLWHKDKFPMWLSYMVDGLIRNHPANNPSEWEH